MKGVLISIRPQWCAKIANGEKTIEVRKNRPKLDTPFKCYIYCTKQKAKHALHTYVTEPAFRDKYGITNHWRSGEYIVNVNAHLPAYRHNEYLAEGKVIGEFVCDSFRYMEPCKLEPEMIYKCCVGIDNMESYAKGNGLYFWHISDLQIYDKPIKLSEFGIKRAPQSWFYCDNPDKPHGCTFDE